MHGSGETALEHYRPGKELSETRSETSHRRATCLARTALSRSRNTLLAHAHWRPSYPGVGSWLAQRQVRDHDQRQRHDDGSGRNLTPLTAVGGQDARHAASADRQSFVPSPAGDIDHLALDQDGILGRAIPSNPDLPIRQDADAVWGRAPALNQMQNPIRRRRSSRRPASTSLRSPGPRSFRTRDAAAARALFGDWITDDPDVPDADGPRQPIDPPAGTADDVKCFAPPVVNGKPRPGAAAFCYVKFEPLRRPGSGTERAGGAPARAAQYALLGQHGQGANRRTRRNRCPTSRNSTPVRTRRNRPTSSATPRTTSSTMRSSPSKHSGY